MIRVNARLFKAASLCQGSDETRHNICGVHVEPHPQGALLVATDGHRLIAILDRRGEARRKATIALPGVMLRALVEDVVEECDGDDGGILMRSRCEDRTLRVDDAGIAAIGGQVSSAESCIIDGAFPDWRRILPRQPAASRPAPAFTGQYVAAFAEIADLLGDRGYKAIQIAPASLDGPALVFFPHFRDAVGVLMPIKSRFEEPELCLPVWIGAPAQAAAAASA